MGWGAAKALAEEWSDWCEGPEEAYDILYGRRENPKQVTNKMPCPICGKKFKGVEGVSMHMAAKHKKRMHESVKAEFRTAHGIKAQEPSNE